MQDARPGKLPQNRRTEYQARQAGQGLKVQRRPQAEHQVSDWQGGHPCAGCQARQAG